MVYTAGAKKFIIKEIKKMAKKSNTSHLGERRTHVLFIGTESGLFNSFDEAVKAADALKDFLTRTCNENDYHCVGIIGVSRLDSDSGKMVANKLGKREFESLLPNGYKKETPPHIHLLLVANPASMLKAKICEYFQKKYHKNYRQKVTWEKFADADCDGAIRYVLDQSEKIRTVDLFSEELNPWATCFIYTTSVIYCLSDNKKRLFPQHDNRLITKTFCELIREEANFEEPSNFTGFFTDFQRLFYLPTETKKLEEFDLWNEYAEECIKKAKWSLVSCELGNKPSSPID